MADRKTTSATTAAQRIGRHPQTVRRWCAEKNFGVRVGGRWEIPNENVERVLNALSSSRTGIAYCAVR
jgi:predicted site-specific integrase-resolvase